MTCSVTECGRPTYGRGLCQKHHRRLLRTGTTDGRDTDRLLTSGYTTGQIHRFWTHVDQSAGPNACWPWTGYVDPRPDSGYGVWHYTATQRVRPHRAAWAIANNRPTPDDLDVDHVRARGCTRRDCCNPTHLEAVTHAENMARLPAHRNTSTTGALA